MGNPVSWLVIEAGWKVLVADPGAGRPAWGVSRTRDERPDRAQQQTRHRRVCERRGARARGEGVRSDATSGALDEHLAPDRFLLPAPFQLARPAGLACRAPGFARTAGARLAANGPAHGRPADRQIGRASCRERV